MLRRAPDIPGFLVALTVSGSDLIDVDSLLPLLLSLRFWRESESLGEPVNWAHWGMAVPLQSLCFGSAFLRQVQNAELELPVSGNQCGLDVFSGDYE